MRSQWFERPDLVGPTVRLTPLGVDDAADYRAALGDEETTAQVLAHLSLTPPPDDEAARLIIEEALTDPDRLVYGQRLRASGELVGTTSFYEIRPELRAVAIGHTWLARRCWRTGVNTESKLLMLGHAFDDLGAERVVWHTDIRNTRSQAAIERLGATREGVLRHHRIRRDGSWRDTVQFSMLSGEWPGVRARLQTRLDDGAPLTVTLDEAASAYRGRIGDQLVGSLEFVTRGSTLVVTHTETDPAWRGQGIAGRLTRVALDDIRARGARVRPVCPYTTRFIAEHPEYQDLLA